MKAALRRAWMSRAPRERIVIAALAALIGVACYVWLLHAAEQARAHLGPAVAALGTQAAVLDQHAAEYERLRKAPTPTASPGDLRTLMQARAQAAGLSGALTRMEASDMDHVDVTFGAVPFADWLAWTTALQTQHVRLETVRIEAMSAPGLVSVKATFARARPQ